MRGLDNWVDMSFPVRKTGVSLEPILRAARDFLATLDLRQQRQVSFNIQSDVWRSWSNVHPFLMRHGLGLHELTAAQREAALALVSSALSASGFETARNVMKLNEHACELTGLTEEYSEWYYWLSILGTPSAFEPWGWQFDGHHLIINCFILGDQLVLTPQFMGSEPVFAESGKYAGTQVFRAEEAVGLAMMRELSPEQQAKAIIGTLLPGEVLTAAYNDNVRMPYEGIRYDDLSSKQQGVLRDLIGVYLHRLRPGHAKIQLEDCATRTFPGLARTTTTAPSTTASTVQSCSSNSTISQESSMRTTNPPAIISTRSCAPRTATTTARTCCASITRGTIIPTRGARTASAKSNVNRPAPVSLIDLLMIFRFNTKYAPRLSPSPHRTLS